MRWCGDSPAMMKGIQLYCSLHSFSALICWLSFCSTVSFYKSVLLCDFANLDHHVLGRSLYMPVCTTCGWIFGRWGKKHSGFLLFLSTSEDPVLQMLLAMVSQHSRAVRATLLPSCIPYSLAQTIAQPSARPLCLGPDFSSKASVSNRNQATSQLCSKCLHNTLLSSKSTTISLYPDPSFFPDFTPIPHPQVHPYWLDILPPI